MIIYFDSLNTLPMSIFLIVLAGIYLYTRPWLTGMKFWDYVKSIFVLLFACTFLSEMILGFYEHSIPKFKIDGGLAILDVNKIIPYSEIEKITVKRSEVTIWLKYKNHYSTDFLEKGWIELFLPIVCRVGNKSIVIYSTHLDISAEDLLDVIESDAAKYGYHFRTFPSYIPYC